MSMGILFASVSVHYGCAWGPQRPEEASDTLESQMIGSYHMGAGTLAWKISQWS